jgi:hypothetical protein
MRRRSNASSMSASRPLNGRSNSRISPRAHMMMEVRE